MKLSLSGRIPREWSRDQMVALVRELEQQVNQLAEGRIQARHFTATSIPTTGDFAQDDIIWKKGVVEQGAGGSKYVTIGWVCTVAGSPGTLLEMRVLTGN